MKYVLSSVHELDSEEFAIGGSGRSRPRRSDRNAPEVETAGDVNEDALKIESESDEPGPDADASADTSDEIDLEYVHDEIEADDVEVETENIGEVEIDLEDAADDAADEAKEISEEPKPTKVKKQRGRRAPKMERPKRSRPTPSRPKLAGPGTRPRRITVSTVVLVLGLVAVGVFAGLQEQRLSAAREDNVRLQQLNASQVQQIARLTGDAEEMDAKVATLTTKVKALTGGLTKARTEAESSKMEADKATQSVRKLTSQANTLLAQATQELDELVAAVEGVDVPAASGAATAAQTLLDNAASVVAQITSAK